ncbi:hypothetical protein KR093_003378 [Drosophila rubida]|uniref:Nucleotide exchange factor SIL1 n=1 Tax=Drosophila rubida TaxID=30044 RepID=A0AAD4JSS9_9MUSC|nr:hypothetical protein KR093_003378 [Drosophila rubida]
MHSSTILIVLAAGMMIGCPHVSATEPANKTEEFVATEEWQVVAEGQSIPKGLHVRINLQTGVKEAKLLDESERGTALQSKSSDEEKPLSLEHKVDIVEESVRKVKEHRSYAELRKAYKDFQKNFRTDGELILQLVEQYRNLSKTSVQSELKIKLNVLENLEYLLHQIDNALVFIDHGSLDDILLPIVVNETNADLRISAMRVLGALTGNNPKVQIKVFERNFGSHFAQILMTSSNSAEISSALHAFGALLRKFPLAQQRILSTSGTQALIGVLRSSDVELRNKAKVVTLISDLMVEKQSVLDASADAPDTATTVAQYVLLDFETWLQSHGYCTALEAVLSQDYVHLLDQPEAVEQFTIALESTESVCLWSKSASLRHALLTIRNRFSHSQDEYRLEVSQALAKVCESFYEKQIHVEL